MEIEEKRLTIGIDEDIFLLMKEIKGITGNSYNKQIKELLRQMRPALEMILEVSKTIKALDNSKKSELKKISEGFEESFGALSKKARGLVGETNQQIDMFTAAISKAEKTVASEGKKNTSKRGRKKVQKST